MNYHKSVLLQEAMHFLAVKAEGRYIDATLGGGGHAVEIVRRGGYVIGLDQDDQAIANCTSTHAKLVASKRLICVKSNFINLTKVAADHGWRTVDGVIFDLGASSHQFDEAVRGFSFQKEGPLDMRMDTQILAKAADLINTLPADQLSRIFTKFGEESQASLIAKKIVDNRPLTTTMQLANLIGSVDRSRRVFQALRIAVNDELGSLEMALPQALNLLSSEGRLVVISFHSLEDRIVKNTFREWSVQGKGVILTHKPLIPTDREIDDNPRSQSAKLRVFVKS